jgi:HlyD family secretion protein
VPSASRQRHSHPAGPERISSRGNVTFAAASLPSRFAANPSAVLTHRVMPSEYPIRGAGAAAIRAARPGRWKETAAAPVLAVTEEETTVDRKRALRIAVPAAVVAAAGALVLLLGGRGGAGAAPAYETAAVTRGRVASVVTASGTLSPLVTVEVGSQVSGRVQALHVDFNSKVRKGQVIARIDPSLFESQVAQARANEAAAVATVQGAEATLAEARRQHERNAALAAKSLVAQADADAALAKRQAAEADLASARAKVAQARAARLQADTNLAYTVIASPIDGVVISRDVDVGQTVAASLQAPKLFTLAEDLKKMEVHTDLAEADVGRVAAGLAVEFSVDAFPSERFAGVVKEVRYSPKTVQNVVTYDAVVSVDNAELKLRPGMTADVTFLVEELPDALLVPNAALRFRPPGAAASAAPAAPGGAPRANGAGSRAGGGADAGARPAGEAAGTGRRRAVWVLGADGAAPRAVQIRTGPSDGKNTAVLGGELAEGERVIVGIAGAAPSGGTGPQRPAGPPGRFL